ncbi:MAG TPA: hypothetical protein VLH60_01725, partial [Sedimentisphaerales bacterium]|nr:hypothetical protein [Sedimentisphaerales bacterium]
EMGLSEAHLPPAIAAKALLLLSDTDASVRLATARVLTLKTNLDSAAKLLEQLRAETEENVRLELLSALGAACYFALLPGSQIQLSGEIRAETLDIAARYLMDEDIRRAARGADVVGKLLEQNGVGADIANKYLTMLQQRYVSAMRGNSDSSLRIELLQVMRRLCEAGAQRASGAGLFGPIFLESIRDSQAAVRDVALAGLIAIDRANAMAVVRQYDLASDESAAVRAQAIRLAGGVGDVRDMDWLAFRLGISGEVNLAWQSMRQIFARSDVRLAAEWVQKLGEAGQAERIGDAEWLAFLASTEQRAGDINGGRLAHELRRKLASLHRDRGAFDNAASYYKLLMDSATNEEKDSFAAAYVEMCLKGTSPDGVTMVAAVVAERVSGAARPGDAVLAIIEEYLAANPGSDKTKSVLEALGHIKGNDEWHETLARWHKQYAEQGKELAAEGG